MKRTSTVLLAVLATALAKPSHSDIAALLLRQSGSDLLARSGINPSSISIQCQPGCLAIINSLDLCKSPACECTQANYNALGNCINCLIELGPQFVGLSPGVTYLDSFLTACAGSGIELNEVSITVTPTGIASTGDPLSIFEVQTPTPGATEAVSFTLPPLIPTPVPVKSSGSTGSAIELNAFRALGMSVVAATAATIVTLGASSL